MKKSLKICIVTSEYPPNVVAGPGSYCMNLLNGLLKLGHKVTILTPLLKGGEEHEVSENLEVYRIKIATSNFLESWIPNFLDRRILLGMKVGDFIKKNIKLEEYDLLHVLNLQEAFFLDDPLFRKIPTLVTINEYYYFESSWNPFAFPYYTTDFAIRYFHHNIMKAKYLAFLPKVTRIISDTQYLAKDINTIAKIPQEKIDAIYKGINIQRFAVEPPADKYKNHSILFVGGNMERKGVKYLVQAMKQIAENYPDAKLKIIGKASSMFKKDINKIMLQDGTLANVELIDYCAPEEIWKHYQTANVFIMPSIIEDLAQTLMEAMASQTPCVATEVGANPEGVDDQTGTLIPPKDPKAIADAIISIFKDPETAQWMGKNGVERVKTKFAPERMLKETLETYYKTIEGYKTNLA